MKRQLLMIALLGALQTTKPSIHIPAITELDWSDIITIRPLLKTTPLDSVLKNANLRSLSSIYKQKQNKFEQNQQILNTYVGQEVNNTNFQKIAEYNAIARRLYQDFALLRIQYAFNQLSESQQIAFKNSLQSFMQQFSTSTQLTHQMKLAAQNIINLATRYLKK